MYTYFVYIDGLKIGSVEVFGSRESSNTVFTSTNLRSYEIKYPIRSICKKMFLQNKSSFYENDLSVLHVKFG